MVKTEKIISFQYEDIYRKKYFLASLKSLKSRYICKTLMQSNNVIKTKARVKY